MPRIERGNHRPNALEGLGHLPAGGRGVELTNSTGEAIEFAGADAPANLFLEPGKGFCERLNDLNLVEGWAVQFHCHPQ